MTYHNWTKQEISLLSKAVKKHGLNWAIIQRTYFPEFNVISIKNKYYAVAHEIMVRRQEKAASGQSTSQDEQVVQKSQEQIKNESSIFSEDDLLKQIRIILTQNQQ
ncbi:Conserved_hypothetical protein [Hexamita inflata]|uniref:Myb-like domain-containing protein n=1 Tax=Hexamita inflata TaxID=28002 RepID=A0AA86N6V8_9EUKA|nr:Conserved hypothetical protein [Hexamita inflata]